MRRAAICLRYQLLIYLGDACASKRGTTDSVSASGRGKHSIHMQYYLPVRDSNVLSFSIRKGIRQAICTEATTYLLIISLVLPDTPHMPHRRRDLLCPPETAAQDSASRVAVGLDYSQQKHRTVAGHSCLVLWTTSDDMSFHY